MPAKYKWTRKSGKKQTVHRYLMELKLGRELFSNEFVYFLDQDPTNLNIDNLILITKKLKRKS